MGKGAAMIIDRNKPLPDHTKIDYDECCALLILKELFPDRYSTLVLSDNPDLQGLNVGVEVTIADSKNHLEVLNNWVKAYNCENDKEREKHIERMEQLGVPYTGGVQAWPGYSPSLEEIKEAVNRKVAKLKNGNYKPFTIYELFIFTNTWMYDDRVKDAQQFFKDNNAYESYERIYILEKGYKLFVFEKNNSQQITINITEQTERNMRARKMVEDAEIE